MHDTIDHKERLTSLASYLHRQASRIQEKGGNATPVLEEMRSLDWAITKATQQPVLSCQMNRDNEPMWPVYLTIGEMEELILLIDDDEVDEDFLRGIRRKLSKKMKKFRREDATLQSVSN